MEALIAGLLEWIGRNSEYDISDVPQPAVMELSATELTAEYYAGQEAFAPASGVDPRIFSLYNFEDSPQGVIYILAAAQTEGHEEEEDPLENPIFQERLLHELVHHVQHHGGAYEKFTCRKAGEMDAYRLGGLFLKQRHVQDPLPNRRFWAKIFSRC